jgi:hypothetical protein
MTPTEIEATLKPGDCLLYRPKGFFGFLIGKKTWHRVAHCEMYIGKGRSVASRDGKGVAVYPWRNTELGYVLRPLRSDVLDWASFWKWFATVNGQKYDWFGLLRFVHTGEAGKGDNGKMFCSEFLTRAYWALDARVISKQEDADAIAPFQFLVSPNLTVVGTEMSLR